MINSEIHYIMRLISDMHFYHKYYLPTQSLLISISKSILIEHE